MTSPRISALADGGNPWPQSCHRLWNHPVAQLLAGPQTAQHSTGGFLPRESPGFKQKYVV